MLTKAEILEELEDRLAILASIARDQVPGLYDKPVISQQADVKFEQMVLEIQDLLTDYARHLKRYVDQIEGTFQNDRGERGGVLFRFQRIRRRDECVSYLVFLECH